MSLGSAPSTRWGRCTIGRCVGVARADQRLQRGQDRRGLGGGIIWTGEVAEGGPEGAPGPRWSGVGGLLPVPRRDIRAAGTVRGRNKEAEDAAGMDRADALVQPQQPEPGQVPAIGAPPWSS
jgi:hypothetical protein